MLSNRLRYAIVLASVVLSCGQGREASGGITGSFAGISDQGKHARRIYDFSDAIDTTGSLVTAHISFEMEDYLAYVALKQDHPHVNPGVMQSLTWGLNGIGESYTHRGNAPGYYGNISIDGVHIDIYLVYINSPYFIMDLYGSGTLDAAGNINSFSGYAFLGGGRAFYGANVAVVPEPSTLAGGILGVVLAGTGYYWRRRHIA